MRIISGKFKGRKFNPPLKKWPTRPTMDYAREALFNILENNYQIDQLRVLDLFAGTGVVGLEFLSRACIELTSVEKYPASIQFLNKVKAELNIGEEWSIIRNDVLRFLKSYEGSSFDLIFMDPPYDYPLYHAVIDKIFETNILQPDGTLIVEHDAAQHFEQKAYFIENRKYGSTFFSFFSREIS